jgi:hypothetical protein
MKMKNKKQKLLIDMSAARDVHQILDPCPPIGEGVHFARHGAICKLALLGFYPDEIREMIVEWGPNEPRKIEESLQKVFADGDPRFRGETFTKAPTWPDPDFSEAMAITREHGKFGQFELMVKLEDASPIDPYVELTTAEWLSLFYQQTDLLCIGENLCDREVRSLADWNKRLRYAHFISPNPFRFAYLGRKNENVLERRYLITEIDIKEVWRLLLDRYEIDPFDFQAAIILYLKDLKNLRLHSVVWSGNKSLHALWRADKDESVNLAFMTEAVRLGVDKAGYALSQFCRIFNPLENQRLFYLD